jgi:hypothetical protein
MIEITNQAEFNDFFQNDYNGSPSECALRQLLKFYALVKEYGKGIEFPQKWLMNSVPLFYLTGILGAYEPDENALYYIYKNRIARICVCESVIKRIVQNEK